MAIDKLVRLMQLAGALLAIPVAATGTVSVYRSYFSSDVLCQNMRSAILTTMDKNVPPQAKLVLLRKDVEEFEKNCATIDPDANGIFRTTMQQLASRAKRAEVASEVARPPLPQSQSASVAPSGPPAGSTPAADAPRATNAALPLFNLSATSQLRGWVVVIRGDKGHEGEPNFEGYTIESLPPVGAVLNARRLLWVWSEPKGDPSNVRARLSPGACVRVLSTRKGPIAAWAEVMPAPCS